VSAIEVIEQIKKLPREEQQKVAAYLSEVAGAPSKPDDKVSDEFKRVADGVFSTNAELFRKLAQ